MTQSKDKSQEKQEYIRYFLFVGLKEILLCKVDLAFLEYNLVILDGAHNSAHHTAPFRDDY